MVKLAEEFDLFLPFKQVVEMVVGLSTEKAVIVRLSLVGTQESDLRSPAVPIQLVLTSEQAAELALALDRARSQAAGIGVSRETH